MGIKRIISILQVIALFIFSLSIALMPVVSHLYYLFYNKVFLYINSLLFWIGLITQLSLYIIMRCRKIEFSCFARLARLKEKVGKKFWNFSLLGISIISFFGIICLLENLLISGFILISIAVFLLGLTLDITKCTNF